MKKAQFEKSILKKDLLIKISETFLVRETLNNNSSALQHYFAEKMITCVLKSSFLKLQVAIFQ